MIAVMVVMNAMAVCTSPPPRLTVCQVLEVAHAIYSKMNKWHDALRVALQLNRRELVESTFTGRGGSCGLRLGRRKEVAAGEEVGVLGEAGK